MGETEAAPALLFAPATASADPDALDPFLQLLRRYNHECRNSLSAIKMGLYLFERESTPAMAPRWNELSRVYEDIEKVFDRLQMIYRTSSLTWIRCPLGQLIAERLPTWRAWFDARGRRIDVKFPPCDTPGDFDPMYLGSGLDAFAAWRAAASDRDRPRLSWQIKGGRFEVSWDETDQTSESCASGRNQGSSARYEQPECTASLALIFLGRVVSAHGGIIEAKSAPGFRATLRWPQICAQGCMS
jgi:hypothetical protein